MRAALVTVAALVIGCGSEAGDYESHVKLLMPGAWSESVSGASHAEEFTAPAGPTIWTFPLALEHGSILNRVSISLDPEDMNPRPDVSPAANLARSGRDGATELLHFVKIEGSEPRELDLLGGDIEVNLHDYYYSVRVQTGPSQAVRVNGPPDIVTGCP